jgi:hypothetical protein
MTVAMSDFQLVACLVSVWAVWKAGKSDLHLVERRDVKLADLKGLWWVGKTAAVMVVMSDSR